MTLTVYKDGGITVPDKYHEADKIVVRTPSSTLDVSSGFSMMIEDGVYPLVSSEDFSVSDEKAENPELNPNFITFKAYGEDAEKFEVELETN